MSDLGDRMEAILGRTHQGEKPSLVEVARDFREHFGSGRKAAKALGVNESTFRRIVTGKTTAPKPATLGAFERLTRTVSGARRIGLGDIRIPVTTMKQGRRHGRERELGAANLRITDPQAAERIRNAYIAGGKEAAAGQLITEIQDPHYKSWLAPSIPDEGFLDYADEIELEPGYGYAVH